MCSPSGNSAWRKAAVISQWTDFRLSLAVSTIAQQIVDHCATGAQVSKSQPLPFDGHSVHRSMTWISLPIHWESIWFWMPMLREAHACLGCKEPVPKISFYFQVCPIWSPLCPRSHPERGLTWLIPREGCLHHIYWYGQQWLEDSLLKLKQGPMGPWWSYGQHEPNVQL